MKEDNSIKYAKITIIGVVVVAIVGLIVWGFLFQKPKEVLAPTENILPTTSVNTYRAPTVDVKHQYKNSIHTYAGMVSLPTPCYSLKSDISITDKNPINILIDLNSKNSADVCSQVITPTYFKVSITGPKIINLLKGTLDGKVINFNIFEVPENEDIDAYDVYFKG